MTKAVQKISLSSIRDIPFNKLMLSEANVRRLHVDNAIEDLANDIERRGLLQSLNVRPVVDNSGEQTGMFEIPAGGRRFRALELLVKQKRLAKTAPIPCVVRMGGDAEEDSLAENIQRAPFRCCDPKGRTSKIPISLAPITTPTWQQSIPSRRQSGAGPSDP